jgi:hypothetical protein
VLDHLLGIGRSTPWVEGDHLPLRFDVHHPQGLCRSGGTRWLTTVDTERARGFLIGFDDAGGEVVRTELVDGERFHPGGFDVTDAGGLVALAEYRPHSSTRVLVTDLDAGECEPLFDVEDHLGAIVAVDDRRIFAVTWGSRELVLFDWDGRVLDARPNPTHVVDFQDVQLVDDGVVACTGTSTLVFGDRLEPVGGVGLVELDGLTLVHEAPITIRSDAPDRALTYNGVRFEAPEDRLVLEALADDGTDARLLRWAVG